MKQGGCGECQTSCQPTCKTSCTVGNQSCENKSTINQNLLLLIRLKFGAVSKYVSANLLDNRKYFVTVPFVVKVRKKKVVHQYKDKNSMCSGGCAANSFKFHNDTKDEYDTGCKLQRKRVEYAIMLKAAQADLAE